MATKAEKERAVFQEFVKVCRLPIDIASIVSREEPEPDILCALTTGERIAFELVRVIDQGLAAAIASLTEIPRLLKQKCPPLPGLLGGTMVGVGFRDGLTRQATINLFPLVYKQLEQIPAAFEGEWRLSRSVHRDGITHILISRGFAGLEFSVTPATSIGDPSIEQLQKKFRKSYSSPHPIELLMYYSPFQPCHIGKDFGPNLAEYAARGMGESHFRRVWVYDCESRGVWEYPRLSSDS